MFGWLFTSPPERRLLGTRPLQGPTPWLIAIMTFSIMIVAAAGLALAGTAQRVSAGASARYSVQIPSGDKMAPALRIVRSSKGIADAEAVPEQEMRKTLERWLGPAGASANLPVPALITFDAGAGADLRALEGRVAAIAPGAKVIAHRETLGPVLKSLRALQWIALVLVILLGGACPAAAPSSSTNASDSHCKSRSERSTGPRLSRWAMTFAAGDAAVIRACSARMSKPEGASKVTRPGTGRSDEAPAGPSQRSSVLRISATGTASTDVVPGIARTAASTPGKALPSGTCTE